MKRTNNTKSVSALLSTIVLLSLLLSVASLALPTPAYASSGHRLAPTAFSSDAATVRYLCDHGKITAVHVTKFQADWKLWNTVRIPFHCVMLADSYVAEGYKFEITSEMLPGQRPNLPMLADTMVVIVRK